MDQQLPNRTIVLLGVGHTNAHVVRMWRMNPLPDARLVCISNFRRATYSGMLPGVLAGQYDPAEMTIDLVRLCQSSGAELIIDEVMGLDKVQQRLEFDGRPALPFDALAVGVGSVPWLGSVELPEDSSHLLTVKPMQTFLKRLNAAVVNWRQQHPERVLNLAIVGAGAGGTEVALCVPRYLQSIATDLEVQLQLVYGSLLPGFRDSTRRRVQRELRKAGISLHDNKRVIRLLSDAMLTEDSTRIPADLVIWAGGATAPPLLERLDLPKDDRGFLLTTDTLKTTAPLNVFAVGDSGTIRDERLPKAGVYAVRQGPILWENLQRTLAGHELKKYRPQTNFLKLLNSGNGRAIGDFRGISFSGTWALAWKDHIDRKFMKMYQQYSAPMMKSVTKQQPDR